MRKVICILLCVCLFGFLVACANGTPAPTPEATAPEATAPEATAPEATAPEATAPAVPAPADGNIVIGVSYDTLDHDYWRANLWALEDEAAIHGVELVVMVAQGDAVLQNQQIDSLIARGVDAIICAAIDSVSIMEAVRRSNEAGIPFLFIDRLLESTAEATISYGVAADNVVLAEMGNEWIVEQARARGIERLVVLELMGSMGDNAALQRSEGFHNIVARYPDFIEVVASVPTDWSEERAFAATINALQGHPDINYIYMHADLMVPAVISALRQNDMLFQVGEPGHVMLGAVNGDRVALDAILDGYMDVVMVLPVVDQSRMALRYALELIRGNTLDGFGVLIPGFLVHAGNFDAAAPEAYGFMEFN